MLADAIQKPLDLLLSVAAAVLVVGAVSWFLANRYGGKSRTKRRAIFNVAASVGMMLVGLLIYFKATGRL